LKDVPADYYLRLHSIEEHHWWHVGMREVSAAVLGERLHRRHQSLLDAGCGTGGFLGWASRTGAFDHLAGVDISPQAVDFARESVPGSDLRVAPLHALPFDDEKFDVVALNDVLQHVEEREVEACLREVRRVVRRDGAVLVRTNAGRRPRRERSDWRLYDQATLESQLDSAGLRLLRITHANMLLSGWGAIRGRSPVAPTATTCGIPGRASPIVNAVGTVVLRLEARYLRGSRRRLPYGHTLLALAVPAPLA
jgi:ubiquinone/menaquinone biosynthesis C-methylase UbiE